MLPRCTVAGHGGLSAHRGSTRIEKDAEPRMILLRWDDSSCSTNRNTEAVWQSDMFTAGSERARRMHQRSLPRESQNTFYQEVLV